MIFWRILLLATICGYCKPSESGGNLPIDDVDESEDTALEEMQRELEEEEARLTIQFQADQLVASEAERAAKAAEAAALESERAAKLAAKSAKPDIDEGSDRIRRSRPGSKAKPGSNLKSGTVGSETKLDEKKSRDRVPDSLGSQGSRGSYFGEDPKEKERAVRAAEAARRAQEKDKISSAAGDTRRELESKIDPRVRARAAAAAAKRAQEAREQREWEVRAALPRRYAGPVEKVLRLGDKEGDSRVVSQYRVLGVSNSVDEDGIKRAYRLAALRLHPDKNPHPDAKLAFEMVQEAFETLSSPLLRAQHDELLRVHHWMRTLTIPKLRRRAATAVDNVRSRALLLIRRAKDGDLRTELEEVQEWMRALAARVQRKLEHFKRLPSNKDRLALATEMLVTRNTLIAAAVFILRFFIR